MTDKKLEQALRRALTPREPGEAFTARVMARLDADRQGKRTLQEAEATPISRGSDRDHRRNFRRWSVPVGLAACAMLAVGLMHWRGETAERERSVQARAQLLQALNIAGAQLNTVRAAVLREEQPLN
jgi:negative regulator of sigma E activity